MPIPAKVGLILHPDGSLTLQGTLSDAAEKSKLLAAARRVFGASRVDDALEVDAGSGPLGRLIVRGTAPDEAAKTRATLDAAKMVGVGVVIDNRLEIKPGAKAANAATSAPPRKHAPPAAVSEQQHKLRAVLSARAVEFEISSANLSSAGRALLDEIVPIIQSEAGTRIQIQGHTDARGDPQANLALSQARATATLDYLAAKGVDASRLSAHGYGQERPVADNETAAGRRQNRRIDFLVKEGN